MHTQDLIRPGLSTMEARSLATAPSDRFVLRGEIVAIAVLALALLGLVAGALELTEDTSTAVVVEAR